MWCQRPVIVLCQWRRPVFSSGACARSEHPCPGDNVDSNERHGQVNRNTLIASVVIESVIVSANISFVVAVRIPPVVRPRFRLRALLIPRVPSGQTNRRRFVAAAPRGFGVSFVEVTIGRALRTARSRRGARPATPACSSAPVSMASREAMSDNVEVLMLRACCVGTCPHALLCLTPPTRARGSGRACSLCRRA